MALKSGRVGIHPSQVDPITGMLIDPPGGASDLSDLNDVNIENPEIGQLLVYDGNKWENQFASISPVTPATLQSLQDVLISSPASGQTLEYDEDNNKWVNVYASISPMTLSQLQDVVITDPQDDDYLIYDSTEGKWINSGSAPGPVVPEGSTVTPTDDIQTWLACAGITDKTYTTLNEVLADSTTLLALISSNNASDYLVRSTTWASGVCANSTAMTDIGANNYCANTLLDDATWCDAICNSTYFESVLNVKVPTMTSMTTPSGVVICSSNYGGNAPTWKMFDGNTSTEGDVINAVNCYFGYQFTSAVKLHKIVATGIVVNASAGATWQVKGSNDGTTWSDSLYSKSVSNNTNETFVFDGDTAYTHWVIWQPLKSGGNGGVGANELQFYGREDV